MPTRCLVRVELRCPSRELSEALEKSIKPELLSPPTSRSRVSMEVRDGRVRMAFEAREIPALRAALNSYLRWVSAVQSTLRRLGLDAEVC